MEPNDCFFNGDVIAPAFVIAGHSLASIPLRRKSSQKCVAKYPQPKKSGLPVTISLFEGDVGFESH